LIIQDDNRRDQTRGPSTDGDIWAVLPVKDIEGAKGRLSPVLSPTERQSLFRAMLEDVLEVLSAVRRLSGVLLVTKDQHVCNLGQRFAARTLTESENQGQTAAVTLAAKTLVAEGVHGMITIPADVPLATSAEINALLQAHASAPAITIAPAHNELGSNAVVCSPPDILPLCFGDNSFLPHLKRARQLGIEPRIVSQPGLSLDIDTPEDLVSFVQRPSLTRAFAYLRDSGIALRLTTRADGTGTA